MASSEKHASESTHGLIVVGHLSRDVIIIEDDVQESAGGGVFYAGKSAHNLHIHPLIILSKCASEDKPFFMDAFDSCVHPYLIESPMSTSCVNHYPSRTSDARKQKIPSKACPFTLTEVQEGALSRFPSFCTLVFCVTPMFFGEFPPDLVLELKRLLDSHPAKGILTGDIQGWIRQADDNTGAITCSDASHFTSPSYNNFLSCFDVLKVGFEDTNILLGRRPPFSSCTAEEFAVILHEFIGRYNMKSVLGTLSDGIILVEGGFIMNRMADNTLQKEEQAEETRPSQHTFLLDLSEASAPKKRPGLLQKSLQTKCNTQDRIVALHNLIFKPKVYKTKKRYICA